MFRLTFAQMRRSIGRLSAAGIAIAIGTAFVAATLLAGNAMTRAAFDSVAASFGQAQVVVTSDGEHFHPLTEQQLATISATPGVVAVQPVASMYLEIVGPARSTWINTTSTATDPALDPQDVTVGAVPDASGEIALPSPAAERLGVGIGDPLTVQLANSETGEDASRSLTVVGLLDDPYGAYAMTDGAVMLTPQDFAEIAEIDGWGTEAGEAAVLVADGASVHQVIDRLQTALGSGSDDPVVQTRDERAEQSVNSFTGDQQILTSVVLGFAAVALVVAGLVIANTFQVLVAQRTRTLAMLRCVGANKRQLRRSVLLEASVLGLIASVVGIVAGSAVVQVVLSVLGTMDLGVPVPAMITLSPAVVIVPLLAGVVVTTLSALSPARAATRVSPLAALRPADAPSTRTGAGMVRLVLSLLMVVGGTGLLVAGVLLGLNETAELGLAVGILGGAISFVGLVVGAVFWIPWVTRLVGRLVARGGPAAHLAAANTVRNPRRTAATSTALLIGVTLVVMMSTGAISARTTMDRELDSQYPIDISVTVDSGLTNGTQESETALSEAAIDRIAETPGVASIAPVRTALAQVGSEPSLLIAGIDPADAEQVVHDRSTVESLDDSTVLLADWLLDSQDLRVGDTIDLLPTDADGVTVTDARPISLTVATSSLARSSAIVSTTTLEQLTNAPVSDVWVALDGSVSANTVASELQDQADSFGGYVMGAAVERAMFQEVIDTMLAVIVGLLAVAVIIALIGVANTLSLSVIERQRENAMLRAIGLSRRQLRGTLAVEGILIALVGAVLGSILGLLYGWAGAAASLGGLGDVHLAVPWRDLGLVLLVALAAGLLASVIPARRAVRTSPVEALAVE